MPLTITEYDPSVEPLQVLDSRTIMRHSQLIPQVLIQWNSLNSSTASWEDVKEIKENSHKFNLADKVAFSGNGIATHKIMLS